VVDNIKEKASRLSEGFFFLVHRHKLRPDNIQAGATGYSVNYFKNSSS
jgi:hypothetical protein